jgi:hypothetical protein
MKFTTKKFMSLVFAAGLAAATLKPSTARADPNTRTDREVTLIAQDDRGGTLSLKTEYPGERGVFWAVEVYTYYAHVDDLGPVTGAPNLSVSTPAGEPDRLLSAYHDNIIGSARDMIVLGKLEQALDMEISVNRHTAEERHPIIVCVEVMNCSTDQRGTKRGDGPWPVLDEAPGDRNNDSLCVEYRF